MPYPSLESLPDAVRKLSIHLQRIWKETFNQTWAKYPGDEGRCAATAWHVVNNARGKKSEKPGEGELTMTCSFVASPKTPVDWKKMCHVTKSDSAMKRSVSVAVVALVGIRDGVKGLSTSDRTSAWNHAAKHYSQWNMIMPDKNKCDKLSPADCVNLTSRFDHNLQLFNGDENAALLKSLDEVWDSKLT